MTRILALVAARAGSKGIKDKNLLKLEGKYLLEWISEVLLSCDLVDGLVCSSDSSKILDLASKLGYTPLLRPKKLASDSSKVIDTILHVLRNQRTPAPDYLMLLQATSPCIIRSDIHRAFSLAQSHNYDTVISAYRDEHVSLSTLFLPSPGNKVEYLTLSSKPEARRQDSDFPCIRAGLFYLFKISTLLATTSLYGGRTGYVLIPQSRSANLDQPEDIVILEKQLKELNHDIRFN
ncbi:acylneuraminate cytidylyltransferase family protein [Synechococcus sp. UW140]|uniref:acylneuraminate cytidylyltransferase family protein n=1 Tax=Synechococcus sp. UW140 TaxID=368503 RepID=UPI003137A28A